MSLLFPKNTKQACFLQESEAPNIQKPIIAAQSAQSAELIAAFIVAVKKQSINTIKPRVLCAALCALCAAPDHQKTSKRETRCSRD